MAGILFDTNIWIARSADTLPRQHMMSSVVLQELLAGAVDKTAVQKYEAMKRGYEKADKLLVPDGDDWFAAGRILNALLRGLKSKRGGTIPKLPYQEQYRIIRDVLIARTVRRVGAELVTYDLKDFQLIRRFCNVRVKSGEEYFGE